MIRNALVFGLALLMAPLASLAQQPVQSPTPTAPNTPAGHALASWLAAFNDGSSATYRKFLEAWMPSRLKNINDELQFRAITGGFDLVGIESSTPTKIVAILEDRDNQQYARAQLTTTDTPPYHIASFPILAIQSPPTRFAPRHVSQAELLGATRARLDQAARDGRFSGAVLISHDGRPIFMQAYGLADRANGARNNVNTRFNLGSMNKMFTGVAVLQLVAAGKVRLDATFGTYVKDYPNRQLASQVTIEQLLTHTGGTGDFFGPEFEAHRLQLRTLSDYERLFGARGPAFTPGSRYAYSNYGYILLGLVIERVSGQNYYDYVRQHVFAPAGMTSTGSQPADEIVPNTAIGYTRNDKGELQPNTDTLPYRGIPAGGGYSTVVDLMRFADALLAHRLLSAHYTELLTTGKVDTDTGARYAYGFDETRMNGVRCFGHSGGGPGINGQLEICPDIGYVVASLGNLDPPAASSIADFITNRLPLPPTGR